MTRVVVIPADESACGLYRLRHPAEVLRQARPDWQIDVYRPGDVMLGINEKGRLQSLGGIPDPLSIDLLVMQRTGNPLQYELIKWAQSKGIAVALDSDDAMWAIDRDNTAYKAWNDSRPCHWRVLDACMEIADIVTVTTPALARRYGRHGRVEVLPNYVREKDVLTDSRRIVFDPRPTVGWAGFTGTHPGDLNVVGDAVAQSGLLARVVGDSAGAAAAWGCPVDGIPPVPLEGFLAALTVMDIGLVPLRDTLFNRGKSALKALEMSAVGLPVIASPTPDNIRLSEDLPSIEIAESPGEWRATMLQMARNLDYWRTHAKESQRIIWERHTYEANAEKWATAYERAMARRARMAA